MSYGVRAIREVPREEMSEVVRQCEGIFKNTLIAGACRFVTLCRAARV